VTSPAQTTTWACHVSNLEVKERPLQSVGSMAISEPQAIAAGHTSIHEELEAELVSPGHAEACPIPSGSWVYPLSLLGGSTAIVTRGSTTRVHPSARENGW
jgi:hypothetical protein